MSLHYLVQISGITLANPCPIIQYERKERPELIKNVLLTDFHVFFFFSNKDTCDKKEKVMINKITGWKLFLPSLPAFSVRDAVL